MFTHESKAEEALELTKGRYAVNLGFWVEQSVTAENVLIAAEALLDSGQEFRCVSQAGVVVKAKELEVAFPEWGPLMVI